MEPPLKILIVDRDEEDRTKVRRALAASGLTADVVEASDGADAVPLLTTGSFTCALLDGVDASSAPAVLRAARSAGVDTPIIVLAAAGDDERGRDFAEDGADDHLDKLRLTPASLGGAVRRAIRLGQARSDARAARARARATEERCRAMADGARVAAEQARTAADRARLAAEASEREYRFLAESIPQMVWTAGADGVPTYFNQRWFEYTGQSPSAACSPAWVDALHPDDRAGLLERWAAARHGRDALDAEVRVRHTADGAYRWFLARAVPFRDDDDGRVAKWFGTWTDVDDSRRAREALRLNRERFDLVLEASAVGLWYCDLPFDELKWNERVKEHFWLPPDADVTIAMFYERLHPDDHEPAQAAIEQAVADHVPYDITFRTIDPAAGGAEGGPVRWVRAIGRAFYDAADRPIRFDGITVDVTAHKRDEQELREAKEAAEASRTAAEAARASAEAANAAKDQFLAVLSHELRTPLTPVLSTVQAMEAEEGLPPDVRESIEMIKRNVELEARLIDDLLDLTRISKNKLELHLQSVDVHETLASAIDICRSDLRDRGLDLALDLRAARRHVRADPARLHQVFWNLLKNAVKFTPSGGRVVVRTTNEGDRLRVEVADTGIGIDPQVLPRIFEAFEQGERSITRRFGGLGLGLAISRALIDMQGGRLTAASAGPGCGATFAVDLATADAPPAPRPNGAQSPGGAAAAHPAGLRILLVDDHADTARAMRRLLERAGYVVRTATTVAEAVEAFDREPFDLLVSDIGLPDGSGCDVMRTVRARGAAHGGPLRGIALSGFGMEEDVQKSRDAGFFAHLTKPVNFQHLQATIRRATEEPVEAT